MTSLVIPLDLVPLRGGPGSDEIPQVVGHEVRRNTALVASLEVERVHVVLSRIHNKPLDLIGLSCLVESEPADGVVELLVLTKLRHVAIHNIFQAQLTRHEFQFKVRRQLRIVLFHVFIHQAIGQLNTLIMRNYLRETSAELNFVTRLCSSKDLSNVRCYFRQNAHFARSNQVSGPPKTGLVSGTTRPCAANNIQSISSRFS